MISSNSATVSILVTSVGDDTYNETDDSDTTPKEKELKAQLKDFKKDKKSSDEDDDKEEHDHKEDKQGKGHNKHEDKQKGKGHEKYDDHEDDD